MTATYDREALLNKSRAFIQKGIAARSVGDYAGFQIWATLSLELLGKAALANVHPALVADPSSPESLFAACGRPFSSKVKSIAAKTVVERLSHVIKGFDPKMRAFCMTLFNRRNAELHSGDAPYVAVLPDSWVPRFWDVSSLILQNQELTLSLWVGDEEAVAAEAIINKVMTALEHAVKARVEKCRNEFDERFPRGSDERRVLANIAAKLKPDLSIEGELSSHEPCPACGLMATFGAELVHSEIKSGEPEAGEDWFDVAVNTYQPVAFSCPSCGLKLTGVEELRILHLADEFELEETVEPDYEGEYLNC